MFGLICIKHLQTRRRESLRKPRNARRTHAKTRLTHRTAPVDLASTMGLYPLTLKSPQSIPAERSNPSKKLAPG